MGPSPIHAANVSLILNPKSNRISPQFHCIYDNYFETVLYDEKPPPPMWEDLIVNIISKVDLEIGENNDNFVDTWTEPSKIQDVVVDHSRDSTQAPESFITDESMTLPDVQKIAEGKESNNQREASLPQNPDIPHQRESTPSDEMSPLTSEVMPRVYSPSPKSTSSPSSPPLRRSS